MDAVMDFRQLVWAPRAIAEDWGETPDPVVWIAIDLLDASWCKTRDHYVGPGGIGSTEIGKYSAVGAFLAANIGRTAIFVPSLSLVADEVAFNDGRHTCAWLRDHGLRVLPVEVGRAYEHILRRRFETTERVGQLATRSR
ncbi:hypothetical protein [Burkholderia vietnamiensis]|uniref:hypothetical protein n=1 Tax=Burkholderia vietnamiensis TaxID=60552 RepID=UPI001B9896D7|nr:hypothetical protein [Burkholderia vietnamiensis]MBR8034722.1 hypothetical protein [Burkholderia vietnamiensis]